MPTETASFMELLAEHLPSLYNFVIRMCLDEARAHKVVEETFLRAYVGADTSPDGDKVSLWLLKIAQHVLGKTLERRPEVSFDMLDEILRSEATRTDIVSSLTEPRRDFLLWGLKQGCMTSVVNCLSPGERAAFVLSTVMSLSDSHAAQTLDVSAAAFKVRLSRAKKKISDYLAPRCEHVDPMNPCHCPARVGVALNKGFIKSRGEVSLRKQLPHYGRYGAGAGQDDAPLRDVVTIYGNLPETPVPQVLHDHLIEMVESGAWSKYCDQNKS
ncbi:MAG: RNA polymerase sigma factor [Myxococcales bacterium]|nr:RNA polymerase sigma factor [Myxococcales bacterium]